MCVCVTLVFKHFITEFFKVIALSYAELKKDIAIA
jgi:hypothetical protein